MSRACARAADTRSPERKRLDIAIARDQKLMADLGVKRARAAEVVAQCVSQIAIVGRRLEENTKARTILKDRG